MKRAKIVIFLIIIIGLTTTVTHADVQVEKNSHKRYLMAAMGDSISAGLFAGTYLSWFNAEAGLHDDEVKNVVSQVEATGFEAINLMGTAAHPFETRTTYSWATGKSISSQYMLLKSQIQKSDPNARVSAYNVAVSGAFTSDLVGEASQVVAKMKTGKFDSLKYVTVLIGSNDVCHSRPSGVMKAEIRQTFSLLSQINQAEPIRVLMSGIPRIPETATPDIRSEKTLFGLSCRSIRAILGSCKAMADWTTQAQYNALIQQIQGANELLAEAAADANKSFTNLDVVFSNRIFDFDFEGADLALDCFHPNAATQSRLSQILWTAQPWFQQ